MHAGTKTAHAHPALGMITVAKSVAAIETGAIVGPAAIGSAIFHAATESAAEPIAVEAAAKATPETVAEIAALAPAGMHAMKAFATTAEAVWATAAA